MFWRERKNAGQMEEEKNAVSGKTRPEKCFLEVGNVVHFEGKWNVCRGGEVQTQLAAVGWVVQTLLRQSQYFGE